MKTYIGTSFKYLLAGVVWVWLTLLTTTTASAQSSSTWADTSTAWNTATDWTPNVVPDSNAVPSGVGAVFSEALYTHQPAVNSTAGQGAEFLQFLGSGNITISGSTANLNLGFGATTPSYIYVASGAGQVNLAVRIIPGAGATLTVSNYSANPLIFSGVTNQNINLGGSGTIVFDGPGNILVTNGAIFNQGHLQTAPTFTGTLTLGLNSQAQDYGSVNLKGGTYVLNTIWQTNGVTNSTIALNGGSFIVNGSCLMTNTLTVNSGSLGGVGLIGSPTIITNNGILAPGSNSTTIGALTFTNTLALAGTNTMKLNRGASPNADSINMTNSDTLSLGGVLNIVNLGSAFQLGDTFILITNGTSTLGAGTIVSGSCFTNVYPATPSLGLAWDITRLTNGGDGTLRVIAGAPVATNITYTVPGNTPFTTNAPGVLANVFDAGNYTPLTAISNSAPADGTLVFNSNGSFTYTPNNGFTGDDSFAYSAYDANNMTSGVATVTLNVTITSYSAPSRFLATRSGTNVIFSATNGSPNAPVQLMGTTNITTPRSNWVQIYSNTLDGSGNFNYTNGINPAMPRQFYLLQIP